MYFKFISALILIMSASSQNAHAQSTQSKKMGAYPADISEPSVHPLAVTEVFNRFSEEATLGVMRGLKSGAFHRDEIFQVSGKALYYPGTDYRFHADSGPSDRQSNLNGVCQVLGFAEAIPSGALLRTDSRHPVMTLSIDQGGNSIASGPEDSFVDALICVRNAKKAKAAVQLREEQLVYPGTNLPLSANGHDIDGICKLFGFEKALPHAYTENLHSSSSSSVQIDSNGFAVNQPKGQSVITQIACLQPTAGPFHPIKITKVRSDSLYNPGTLLPYSAVNSGQNTDSNGTRICRVMGFKDYLPGSEKNRSYEGSKLILDESGNRTHRDGAGEILVEISCVQ